MKYNLRGLLIACVLLGILVSIALMIGLLSIVIIFSSAAPVTLATRLWQDRPLWAQIAYAMGVGVAGGLIAFGFFGASVQQQPAVVTLSIVSGVIGFGFGTVVSKG